MAVVLIVEETQELRDLWKRTLEKAGVTVVFVTKPEQASDQLARAPSAQLVVWCNGGERTEASIVAVRDAGCTCRMLAASNDPAMQQRMVEAGCNHKLSDGCAREESLPKTRLPERICELLGISSPAPPGGDVEN